MAGSFSWFFNGRPVLICLADLHLDRKPSPKAALYNNFTKPYRLVYPRPLKLWLIFNLHKFPAEVQSCRWGL